MTTAILKVERNSHDSSNSTTVGERVKLYIDPLTAPLEDKAIFVYEVIPHGAGNVSMFIGILSPSDLVGLVVNEPVTPVIGTRFRTATVDLLFRSKIHVDQAIKLITEDVKEYFRLKSAINTVPLVPIVVVIN